MFSVSRSNVILKICLPFPFALNSYNLFAGSFSISKAFFSADFCLVSQPETTQYFFAGLTLAFAVVSDGSPLLGPRLIFWLQHVIAL